MKKVILGLLLLVGLAALYLGLKGKFCPETIPETPSIPVSPHQDLADLLQQARMEPSLAGSAIGLCVLDDQGLQLWGQNETTSFIPASTLKTVTTATALAKLGPDFRIKTSFLATSPLVAGVLTGDLILKGGGDPMLSLENLEDCVAKLSEQGLVKIQGRIIGDGRLMKGSLYDDFWNWGDIGNGYGSPVSGLNLEHNRFTVGFQPAAVLGEKAMFLGTVPEVPKVEWVSEVTTADEGSGDGIVIHGGERTQVMHLRGTVPLGKRQFTVTGAVPDPELYAAYHLKQLLQQAGIEVAGDAVTASSVTVPEAPVVLLEHESPRLIDIITSIHATSDNHETECIYRLLGMLEGKTPDEVVREHWQSRGLTFEGLRMEDGCGLARADFIRPLDLARIQFLAGSGPHGAEYRKSLLANPDGTVRWKGGAMSGVRSYTGFVRTQAGRELCFALMVNHFTDGQAIATVRDKVLQMLSGW